MATKNVINKTKLSQVTATPASLAVGEQAYSTVSHALFIGDATGTPIKIAGSTDVTKLAGIAAGAQVNTVDSVNGHTGAAVVTASDVGLGNVTNESKATMFTSPTFTGTVSGVTATMVGLGSVTNESKATMFSSPTFTGTVSGVTKAHVGLGSVDNTSDASKPVSTAGQTALNLKANLASPTFTGMVLLPDTGSNAQEAATKKYVDAVATGLNVKDAVRVATSSAGTLATSFANGSSLSGLTLVTGDRILIKDQASSTENGIYTVNASGAPTRAIDFDNTPGTEIKTGAMTYVSSGSLAGTQWVLNSVGPFTLGASALVFVQFGGGQTYSAGTGISLSGSTFSVDGTVLTTSSTLDVTKFSTGTATAFNGSAITNLNASNLATGTVALARMHANVIVDGDTLDGGTF